MNSIASVLEVLDGRATEIFAYPEHASLPPVSSADVEEWVAMSFRNQGTAANYVSALRWACIRFRLSTDWWSETWSKLFVSVKKMQIARLASNELRVKALLDEVLVERTIALADAF